jgi:hypothetical protein
MTASSNTLKDPPTQKLEDMVNPDKTGQERKHTTGKLQKWAHYVNDGASISHTNFGLEPQNLWNNGSNVTPMAYLKT